jgi:SdrD B-like domain/SprB repeat
MTLTHPIPGGTAAVVASVTLPTPDSIAADFTALAPFSTACGLVGSDTITLNNVRVKFRIKYNTCPNKISQEIKLDANAENYCGKKATTLSILPIIYIGVGGNTNEYSISSKVELKEMCSANGETTAVSDQIFIKNLGGGTSPATTSGTDSVMLTIPYNTAQMTITNWNIAAPYGPAIAGTNAKGDVTLKILVPAGIAVNDSLAIPITYDLTPKVDKLCLVATNPPLCYFAEFSTQVILACNLTALNCTSSMPKTIKGSGLSLRQYKCCDVTIGNFVWIDANRDGIQDASELPISGVKVSLYKNGIKIAETTTATNGEYYFTNKKQSGVTWLGTGRDTAVLPLTNYDIVFGEGQYANGKLTLNAKDYFLTIPNEPTSDLTDNDATINTIAGGSYPSILALTSPNKGNDFSFDAGFYCCKLALSFTQTEISCNGKNNGTAKANVTGNIGTLTYIWSNTAATQDISGLSKGVYQVTVTEGTICSIVGSVTITEPSDITLDCTKKAISAFGATDGEASVVASGGTPTYTYKWSNGGTTATITGLVAGTYTVTVTDANGCTKVCSSVLSSVGCTPQNPGTDKTLTCVNNIAPTTTTLVAASSGFTWYVLTQPSGGAAIVNNAGNAYVAGDYIFELKNDTDANCKSTVKITVPSCVIPCPNPNCGSLSVRKL